MKKNSKQSSTKKEIPTQPESLNSEPVNGVEWIHFSLLKGNDYNPNHVAPNELELLKVSILSDGWTQPIVIRADNEIVDGYHRWLLSSTDEEMQKAFSGYVPVVRLQYGSLAHQMMSTIRHNRARGSHELMKMADIVRYMINKAKLTKENLVDGLGMEEEEAERLLDKGNMLKRGAGDEFGKGWKPE